jgi:hypothetical protein
MRTNKVTNAPSSNVRKFLTHACQLLRHIGVYVEQLLFARVSPPRRPTLHRIARLPLSCHRGPANPVGVCRGLMDPPLPMRSQLCWPRRNRGSGSGDAPRRGLFVRYQQRSQSRFMNRELPTDV